MLEVSIQVVHSQVTLRCPSTKAAKMWGPPQAMIFVAPPAGHNKEELFTSCELVKVALCLLGIIKYCEFSSMAYISY